MSERCLSSLDLRAFLRSCHQLLTDRVSVESWTALQKFLLISGAAEFGLYLRQLKKTDPLLLREMKDGFSNGQVESKLWLIGALSDVLPSAPRRIHVLGSWFGLLSRMMSWLPSWAGSEFHSYDVDSRWEKLAGFLNEPESHEGRLFHHTADMLRLDYPGLLKSDPSQLVINTSCEHLEDFPAWFGALPSGTLVALQGNDFREVAEHRTLWNSLEDFKRAAPLGILLYEGELDLVKYRRFLLIGVKA